METTLIILKPDALHLQIENEVFEQLASKGLKVVSSARLQLSPDWIRELYRQGDGVCHDETVDWMSSDDCLLIIIEGPDAVRTVKFEIVGKFPNGLRGRYGQSLTKNVAHAPSSVEEARQELRLVQQLDIQT